MTGKTANRMTGAEAVAECFKLENIKHIFCVPGESYLPLIDAIYDTDIRLISTRHESGAAFMAEAYAKASGKPGVVMATRAVGAANLAIGVHTAFQDSTPLIVILGQVHSKFRGREGFQELDLDRVFSHIAKWAVEIADADRIPELVQRAFRTAKSGRPGPVVISIPEDVFEEEAYMQFGPPSAVPTPRPSSDEVKQVFDILKHAERPLILAGGGVKASDAEDSLAAFAEKYSIPVMTAWRRHDVFPNDHRLYVGHDGLGTFPAVLDSLKEADVLIALGTRFSEITAQDYTILQHQPRLIHVDIDASTLGKVYAPHVGIVADAGKALRELLKAKPRGLRTENWRDWARRRREIYEEAAAVSGRDGHAGKGSSGSKDSEGRSGLQANPYPAIDLKQVIRSLQTLLPEDTILTNDAGNFAGWMHQYYRFNHKKTYIGPTSGAMGYGYPAALGAKLACPDQTVVSLSGDGGFMMTMQELETAVRCGIPVISIVFNNRMYGTIRMHQEKRYPGRVIGTTLGDVDFAGLAKAIGVQSRKVISNGQFDKALIDALSQKAPYLIEVKTDPEQISVQTTITDIRKKSR